MPSISVGDVGDAAGRVERAGALQDVAKRDEVERRSRLRQLLERAEDAPVALRVERLVGEQLLRLVDLAVVEEDRSQDGALRLVGMREGLRKNVLQHGRP